MIHLHPSLAFERDARPALLFYQQALGGDVDLVTYGDWANSGDPTANVADADRDLIVAGTLRTPAGHRITAADTLDAVPAGSPVSVSLVGTPEEVPYLTSAYQALSDGATDVTGFEVASWAPDEHFGTLTDKYGIHWEFGAHPEGRYLL